MQDIKTQIFNVGLFAGIPVADASTTVQAVRALAAGGMYGVIFPWHKQVFETLKRVRAEFPHLLIGVEGAWAQVRQTLHSGASFAVPDAPVDAADGVYFYRKGSALLDPATHNVLARCSHQIVFVEDLQQARWADITRRACAAVNKLLGFELRHVGINNPDEKTADAVAGQFEQFFHFPKEDKGGAFFAGPFIEAMKKPFYGTHGHIAIATPCPARAAWYLEQRGARFNWDSAGYNPGGMLRVVYLQDEIGGFAVHIVQK